MRFPSLLPAVAAAVAGLALFMGASLASAAVIMPRDTVSPSGELSLEDGKKLFTFKYSTPNPDPKNWIGVYRPFYGGPDDEKFIDESLTWAWAPNKDGKVQVDVSKLEPGRYKAYFLAKNGYEWLAKPIDIIMPGTGTGPIQFITNLMTTQNARQGDYFEARVRDLIANPKDYKTKFAKLSVHNDNWVSVSDDGTISGTPGDSDQSANFVVQATASDGSTATISVHIPVKRAGTRLVKKLKVMTYNMWYGGSQVNDYHNKQVRFLINSDVDIVGVQESWKGQGTRLAQALGWYSWQNYRNAIISRYPIEDVFPEQEAAGSVLISLGDNDSKVFMWDAHLGFDPYGPYDFCFDNMPLSKVLEREWQSRRTPQIMEIVKAMEERIANADEIPVLLVGDFNAPSHLDWTDANKDAHCGFGYTPWPSSEAPVKAGLIDSYREAHPDPVTKPGITWSPIYLDNKGRPEPMDRIDFIYYKGSNFKVLKSETILAGKPAPEPHHKDNEWTSDHRAVLTTFKVSTSRDRGDL